MRRAGLTILGLTFVVLGQHAAVADNNCGVDIPAYELRKPGADVPDSIKGFVGKWIDGMWDGHLCHVLIVENMRPDGRAEMIYVWGTYSGWNIEKPGFQRMRGVVNDGVLTYVGRRATVKYELNADDTLSGQYVLPTSTSHATLHRSEGS